MVWVTATLGDRRPCSSTLLRGSADRPSESLDRCRERVRTQGRWRFGRERKGAGQAFPRASEVANY